MKNLLIVVDMQKGFARYEQTIKLTEKIRNLLESKSFDAVIATKFLNAPGSIYEKLFSWKRLESNEEQAFPDGYEQYFDYISEKNVYTCVGLWDSSITDPAGSQGMDASQENGFWNCK